MISNYDVSSVKGMERGCVYASAINSFSQSSRKISHFPIRICALYDLFHLHKMQVIR